MKSRTQLSKFHFPSLRYFGVLLQKGVATSILWVEAKEAAYHPTMHRTASRIQKLSQPKMPIEPSLKDFKVSTLSKLRGGKPGSRTKQSTNYKAHAVSSVWLWSGKPFPPPGGFPNPGMELRSPSLQAASLPAEPQRSPCDSGWTIELFSISGISISALIKISLTCTVHQWSLHLPSSCLVIETGVCGDGLVWTEGGGQARWHQPFSSATCPHEWHHHALRDTGSNVHLGGPRLQNNQNDPSEICIWIWYPPRF